MNERVNEILIISDSKFFTEAIRFILIECGGYSVRSLTYTEVLSKIGSIECDFLYVFMDLDCCPKEDVSSVVDNLKKCLVKGGKFYIFAFDTEPVHKIVEEFVKTLHADGVIKRPISSEKVLSALGY